MSMQTELTAAESRRTLLLYCPYDRKVTRHARRGAANELACLECGRKLDAAPRSQADERAHDVYAQGTAPMAPIGERSARVGGRRSRHGNGPWLRLFIASAALAVGALALVNVVARAVAPSQTADDAGTVVA